MHNFYLDDFSTSIAFLPSLKFFLATGNFLLIFYFEGEKEYLALFIWLISNVVLSSLCLVLNISWLLVSLKILLLKLFKKID
jgi:hypothetical protein